MHIETKSCISEKLLMTKISKYGIVKKVNWIRMQYDR